MKIICVGRNYAAHAKELNNPVPGRPVIFMKPTSAILANNKPLYYPEFTKELHFEGEIVLKIGKNGRHIQREFAHEYYDGVAFGIDFTARDLQAELKAKGHPWELAKGFDNSAALSKFIDINDVNREAIRFEMVKNGEVVQQGDTGEMLFSFEEIIVFVSQYITLQMGDYIYTGTPKGVGPVAIGDRLEGYVYTNAGRQKMLVCEVR